LPERTVPFSRPYRAPGEEQAIAEVLASGELVGGGARTAKAQTLLEELTGAHKVLLTTSGTAALEMACLLLNLEPGDEIIVPSFTFPSCANAIALRGAVPVFVDIRPDTLNIDEDLIEPAITGRTRAIMPVHYGGVGAAMDRIMTIAARHGLAVIEDAAQCIGARYRGVALGSIGDLGALSFHGSKNVSCAEGGALLVKNPEMAERAEILWEKGTNRSQFVRGRIDKYRWVDIGSSFLPSEITAALLLSQLMELETITAKRRAIWDRYNSAFADLAADGAFRGLYMPQDRDPNGHVFAILLPALEIRDDLLQTLKGRGIFSNFHFVPLHSAPAGLRYGRAHGTMTNTDELSTRLLRLPLYTDLDPADQDYVIDNVREYFRNGRSAGH
jgi:dTDP-4-amino-4,6-dideoxygalactose transaminase